jgi:iron-sulfur cluster repair protein YtfE (RIC family)
MPATAITVIHKYIRRELFDLSEQLFRAGPPQVEAIQKALEKIAALLHTHAIQEDARLEPVLRRFDATLADRMARDHRRLDDLLEGCVHASKRLDPSDAKCNAALFQLHLDWNRFVSAYLMHLDDEERNLFVPIADQMPPLAAIVESAKAQGAQGEEFLLRLWAVTTCEERAAIERIGDGVTGEESE